MFRRVLVLFLTSCLSAAIALAQSGVTSTQVSTSSMGGFTGSFTTSTNQLNQPGVTGAPYSAEQVQEQVQTLADGTHITRTGPTQRMWRDSQGRMRTERQMGAPLNTNAPRMPDIVEIRDPVAGVAYILDAQGKVAHRITLQPQRTPFAVPRIPAGAVGMAGTAAVSRPIAARPVDPNAPQFTTEPLGDQTIEGVMATGTRQSTTYPVGAVGNDRPLTATSENWYSAELRTTVLTKSSDPRSGDSTMKLTNISLAEPDPALFMPPADYSVVDEAGPQVTIRYSAQ